MLFDTLHAIVIQARSGVPIEQLASQSGLSRGHLIRILTKYRVEYVSQSIVDCARDYIDGMPIVDIARSRGIHPSTISTWLRTPRYKRLLNNTTVYDERLKRERASKLTQTTIDNIIRLRSEGKLTSDQIALAVGCKTFQIERAVTKGLIPKINKQPSTCKEKAHPVVHELNEFEREMLGLKKTDSISVRKILK